MNRKTFTHVIRKTDARQVLIRQYGATTHVHGYDDEAPTDWKDVYKTYYAWDVVYYPLNDDGSPDFRHGKVPFEMRRDEGSAFPQLPSAIRSLLNPGDSTELRARGDGADWKIAKKSVIEIDGAERVFYEFEVFDSLYGNGYRFGLEEREAEEFAQWLDEVNADALAHSEGI